MVSLLFVLLVLIVVAVALANRAQRDYYPNHIPYGPIMIEFSRVDRICYLLATISVIVGVVSGIALIWGPDSDQFGKVLGTSGLVFVGAVFVLVLNRLMRGRSEP